MRLHTAGRKPRGERGRDSPLSLAPQGLAPTTRSDIAPVGGQALLVARPPSGARLEDRQYGMAITLNRSALDHARQLIVQGKYVLDDTRAWSAHRPSATDENRFIARHGFDEYSRWYLGLDLDARPNTKRRYRFPYGDFKKVHRCGVLAAEFRAMQQGYEDIRRGAGQLRRTLGALKAQVIERRPREAVARGKR